MEPRLRALSGRVPVITVLDTNLEFDFTSNFLPLYIKGVLR